MNKKQTLPLAGSCVAIIISLGLFSAWRSKPGTESENSARGLARSNLSLPNGEDTTAQGQSATLPHGEKRLKAEVYAQRLAVSPVGRDAVIYAFSADGEDIGQYLAGFAEENGRKYLAIIGPIAELLVETGRFEDLSVVLNQLQVVRVQKEQQN